jgi:phosphatidylinositol-3,4,5-trisphosphate 3-phosphatase/dual-specificity protein phosphatase PTEN
MDFLRQIVAGPRARHPEAGLDLCYVTDSIIATSGPSGTYPQVAYRNPLKDLVKFLDSKHGVEWAIWEFRAEGTGYPDAEVYNRIRHYPWPDHHPPPFALVPLIMASMRNWLKEDGAKEKNRVAVVHCKAGKGRSGTVSCSYLISEEGWTTEDAMARFTERRMRPGFGAGISIPSQLRWIGYVDRWTKHGKLYVDRQVEIVELHVWGLRDGVKIAIEGFVDEGKIIKSFHTFQKSERQVVRGSINQESGFSDVATEVMSIMGGKKTKVADAEATVKEAEKTASKEEQVKDSQPGGDVVFKPSTRVVLPSSDINLDFERRNTSKYGGFTMVTSVAHVWFNVFFEGNGPEQNGKADDSGVFSIDFDAMDGIKGSSRKGTKCFDRISLVWKAAQPEIKVITEPKQGEPVAEARPADWKGNDEKSEDIEKKLGLRAVTSASAEISRANSPVESKKDEDEPTGLEAEGVKSSGPAGESLTPTSTKSPIEPGSIEYQHNATKGIPGALPSSDGSADLADSSQSQASMTTDPPVIKTDDLPDHKGHPVGSISLFHNRHTSS